MLERLAERIAAGQRFRPRINVGVADAFIFRPGRNQPPAHDLHRRLVVVVVKPHQNLQSGYTPWQRPGTNNQTETLMKIKTMRTLLSVTMMSLLVILNAPAQTLKKGGPPMSPIQPPQTQPAPVNPAPVNPMPVTPNPVQPDVVPATPVIPTPVQPGTTPKLPVTPK